MFRWCLDEDWVSSTAHLNLQIISFQTQCRSRWAGKVAAEKLGELEQEFQWEVEQDLWVYPEKYEGCWRNGDDCQFVELQANSYKYTDRFTQLYIVLGSF